MSWVKQGDVKPQHVCKRPDGQRLDDLWRCDEDGCRRLWRVGRACEVCDATGRHYDYGGQCSVGVKWRPARFSQRLRYWRQGTRGGPRQPLAEMAVTPEPLSAPPPPPPPSGGRFKGGDRR